MGSQLPLSPPWVAQESPGQGRFRAMPAWPGLGASPSVHPRSGRRAGPCQGWWQCQGAAAVGCAPNRSCWLLPKAVGRHTGAALPPAAAAQGHAAGTASTAVGRGAGRGLRLPGPLTAPCTTSMARASCPGTPSLRGGTPELGSARGSPRAPLAPQPPLRSGDPITASHRAHTGLRRLLGELHCPPRVLCQQQAQLGAQGQGRRAGRSCAQEHQCQPCLQGFI